MNEHIVLLKRELRSITREKTIVLAFIVQLFIASFSSVMLQGIMAFHDPTSISWGPTVIIRAGFVGDTGSPILTFLKSRQIIVRPFSDLLSAESAFRNGQIDTILLVPESQSGVVSMKLILPKEEADKTAILVTLDKPLKKYEDYLRQANGLQINYKDSDDKPYSPYEFLYSVLIPLLMLFPALIAGSIVIDAISEEFENKTFDTLISAPVSHGQIFASKILAAIIMAAIQVLMSAGLLEWNGISIERPTLVLLFAVILALIISMGAATIALFFKDRQRAQFVYSITIIIGGASSYFLNPSPLEILAKLSAGTLDLSVIVFVLYTVIPITIGFVTFYLAERFVLARR